MSPLPEPAASYPARPDVALRHGYTMASLHRITCRAVNRFRWWFLTFADSYEIAWSAVAEALYTSEEPPTTLELSRAANNALKAHVADLGHHHGVYIAGHHGIPPGTRMPRFDRYWLTHAAPAESAEELLIDRLALLQIWPRLTRTHQAVLTALAVHGTYDAAAAALGKTHKTFVTQIYTARKQFLRLWHDGETPSRIWGRDRVVKRRDHRHHHPPTTSPPPRRLRAPTAMK